LSTNNSRYFLTLFLTFFFLCGIAQDGFESGINAGIQLGGSKLLGEMNGSSGMIQEFNNQFGFSGAIEISKYLTPHFELGLGAGSSNLSGKLNNPSDLTAQGLHTAFIPEVYDPIEYTNKLTKLSLAGKYYLKSVANESLFNPFLKAGVGYLTYNSELKNMESGEIFFGKGDENSANLSTGVAIAGVGFKTTLSPHLSLVASADFNFVNYDMLDVVHNYDSDENRIEVKGIFSELKIGIIYTTKAVTGGNKSSGKKGKSSRKRSKHSSDPHLPFAR